MLRKTLQTPNRVIGEELVERMEAMAGLGLGNFAVITGRAGTGKTTWALNNVRRTGGLYVKARQSWCTGAGVMDARAMLGDLLEATGHEPQRYDVHGLFVDLVRRITRRAPRYLCVDEADYLVVNQKTARLINILRDLGDEAGVPILLLSVTRVAERIEAADAFIETVKSRVVAQAVFEPPTLRDAMLFAEELIEGIRLDRDLVAWALSAVKNSLRALMRLYEQIERAAGDAGLTGSLSLQRAIDVGLPPVVDLMRAQAAEREVVPSEKPKATPLKIVGARG